MQDSNSVSGSPFLTSNAMSDRKNAGWCFVTPRCRTDMELSSPSSHGIRPSHWAPGYGEIARQVHLKETAQCHGGKMSWPSHVGFFEQSQQTQRWIHSFCLLMFWDLDTDRFRWITLDSIMIRDRGRFHDITCCFDLMSPYYLFCIDVYVHKYV